MDNETQIVNDLADSWTLHQEILFANGRLYQRAINGMGRTEFIDITKEVAKGIRKEL